MTNHPHRLREKGFLNRLRRADEAATLAFTAVSAAVLIGCGVGLMLGLLGAVPPTIRALRMPIVDGLKAF